MSDLSNKPKPEMSERELHDLEEHDFSNGPLRLLKQAIQSADSANTSLLISLRNNHKLIGKLKAFDRHCNMILENVKEIWYEKDPSSVGKGKKQTANKILKERFVSKMFLRGDSVIVILRHQS
ncbi:unnamed protein product [Ambrosiozyma monospora]|uniref:Small nuclear ribonucleoprotein Sm D2 n=1 Tax=Ambrosiozyma monospora TaxID=43982 RepID=A0A9W6YVJ9_AMBMO|nr:unnamed protein product [Ambrosiozyma monospora]